MILCAQLYILSCFQVPSLSMTNLFCYCTQYLCGKRVNISNILYQSWTGPCEPCIMKSTSPSACLSTNYACSIYTGLYCPWIERCSDLWWSEVSLCFKLYIQCSATIVGLSLVYVFEISPSGADLRGGKGNFWS